MDLSGRFHRSNDTTGEVFFYKYTLQPVLMTVSRKRALFFIDTPLFFVYILLTCVIKEHPTC